MEYEERGGGFKTVAGMRWCLAEMGRYVVMQHNRMKEEGDGGREIGVFYESRVSDTHTWRRGSSSHKHIMGPGAARRGDGRVQLYHMQKRMMGPELKTRRIRGRSRILQDMKRGEEAI